MNEYIAMACPMCGASLRVPENMERLTCDHCGMEHVARRTLGGISLEPVLKRLESVERRLETQTRKINEARLEKEIAELERQLEATHVEGRSNRPRMQKTGWLAIGLLFVSVIAFTVDAMDVGFGALIIGFIVGIVAWIEREDQLEARRNLLNHQIRAKRDELFWRKRRPESLTFEDPKRDRASKPPDT